MTDVVPRSFVHRGSVYASGVLLARADRDRLSVPVEAELIASRFDSRDELFAVEVGDRRWFLHRFAEPRPLRPTETAGAALVEVGDHLVGAPLTAEELRWVASDEASVIWGHHGQLLVCSLRSLVKQAPDTWLSTANLRVLTPSSLAPPPPVVAVAPEKLALSFEQAIGKRTPRTSDEALAFIAETTERRRTEAEAQATSAPRARTFEPVAEGTGAFRMSWWGWLVIWLIVSRLGRWLFGDAEPNPLLILVLVSIGLLALVFLAWRNRPKGENLMLRLPGVERALRAAEGAGIRRGVGRAGLAPGQSGLRRRLKELWISFAFHSRLSRVFGRRQAKYLERMFEMFDKGDLEQALKHAVPVTKRSWNGDLSALTLGGFQPRRDLRLSADGPGGNASQFLGADDLLDQMRAAYRRACQKLEQAGRLEDAAFVYAELLDEEREAIAMLERHGKLSEAAKLAELRDLDPALMVRLWLLAGDTSRAIALAVRHGAFAAAIQLLSKDVEAASQLRMLWADRLATAGDHVGAMEAAWPVSEARALAMRWAELAIAAGGSGGARALTLLANRPEATPADLDLRLRRYLDVSVGQSARARCLLADNLIGLGNTPGSTHLATRCLRPLLMDVAKGEAPRNTLAALAEKTSDALRWDLPPAAPSRPWMGAPFHLTLEPDDCGNTAVFDAAVLSNFHVLLALGEAGVLLLDSQGKKVAHFETVAHALVVADNYNRALALESRGEIVRVNRLDVDGRRSQHWIDMREAIFPRSFDGSVVNVVQGGRLLAVDATAPDLSAVWSSAEFEARPLSVHQFAEQVVVLTEGNEPLHVRILRYRCPSYRLQRKDEYEALLVRPLPHGEVLVRGDDSGIRVGYGHWRHDLAPDSRLVSILGDGEHLALTQRIPPSEATSPSPDHLRIEYFAASQLIQRLIVDLPGAEAASTRIHRDVLTICDDRGRVLGFDLKTGDCIADVRVRV